MVRVGVVGVGIMGSEHAEYLDRGDIRGAQLTSVADPDPSRLAWAKDHLSASVECFTSAEALLHSGLCDGVIVAAPHFLHPPLAMAAFSAGLHVLSEKPIAVSINRARELNAAARDSGRVFGIMYNQRAHPVYQKIRAMIIGGELGEIKRVSWVVTDWYRPQSYYDLGTWRATWAGEGGGVLLNQAPHQLDLWQWMLGMMPVKLRASMAFGRYHDIEVEDDVTAYAEYANGATATFITSTGEAPGTNRLEIAADRGRLVVENGQITFAKLDIAERQFNQEYRGGHGRPRSESIAIVVPPGDLLPVHGPETGHRGITQNWVNAILHGESLLAPGTDGIRGLELSNAMHLSAWTNSWVHLPLDGDHFETLLSERIRQSRGPRWNV